MRTRTRIVPFVFAAVMLGGGTAAAATASGGGVAPQDVQAQSCYGSAKGYTAVGNGVDRAYWPDSGWKYTTSNCADINVKTNYTRTVRACWKDIPCSGWVTAPKGQWTVVKNNVPNGWGFYLEFKGGNNSTGKAAF
ncbi:hypothetical protein AB0O76_28705 [Streptomyces sp. NPDC086554]|uniref:hypothetical protein n=1 Tax=Streptomyces sp. NPDC086554 TaxID=3154864 RepID=UPI00343B8388